MAKRIQLRCTLRNKQGGRCCYCGVELTPPEIARKNHKPRATSETLEHLHRIQDGGRNNRDNMALACHACNTGRGAIDWLTYASYRAGEIA